MNWLKLWRESKAPSDLHLMFLSACAFWFKKQGRRRFLYFFLFYDVTHNPMKWRTTRRKQILSFSPLNNFLSFFFRTICNAFIVYRIEQCTTGKDTEGPNTITPDYSSRHKKYGRKQINESKKINAIPFYMIYGSFSINYINIHFSLATANIPYWPFRRMDMPAGIGFAMQLTPFGRSYSWGTYSDWKWLRSGKFPYIVNESEL